MYQTCPPLERRKREGGDQKGLICVVLFVQCDKLSVVGRHFQATIESVREKSIQKLFQNFIAEHWPHIGGGTGSAAGSFAEVNIVFIGSAMFLREIYAQVIIFHSDYLGEPVH